LSLGFILSGVFVLVSELEEYDDDGDDIDDDVDEHDPNWSIGSMEFTFEDVFSFPDTTPTFQTQYVFDSQGCFSP
ncbi:hypothetical protein LOTGIDRAFT_136836, partial [Lottia gigantea]